MGFILNLFRWNWIDWVDFVGSVQSSDDSGNNPDRDLRLEGVGMKAASIHELKKQMVKLDHGDLLEACLRLARFKKDNKELLTYLLFESRDESQYITTVCTEIDELFKAIKHKKKLYFAKKSVRKIIRSVEKFVRYSGNKDTEVAIRIHFCRAFNSSGIPYKKTKVTANMFDSQSKKIEKALEKLHPDVQHEYRLELEKI